MNNRSSVCTACQVQLMVDHMKIAMGDVLSSLESHLVMWFIIINHQSITACINSCPFDFSITKPLTKCRRWAYLNVLILKKLYEHMSIKRV